MPPHEIFFLAMNEGPFHQINKAEGNNKREISTVLLTNTLNLSPNVHR